MKPIVPIPTLPTGRAHGHPEPLSGATYSAVELMPGNGAVMMLDQRKLPGLERYELFTDAAAVADAIRTMVVRGAPAIGIAAAYGIAVEAGGEPADTATWTARMAAADARLRAARPTAVNLAWALDRMGRVVAASAALPPFGRSERLAAEARAIHAEDVAACRAIGQIGARRLGAKATVLTHCNAGALATGGYGTALGVLRAARANGCKLHVIADETRPLLQGARLTAWELAKDGIPVEIVTDSMVAHLMSKGTIDAVVVGADRIARNGDVANKIGTYGVALVARAHRVPMYVAAPWSTVDMACPSGAEIPIEERDGREVTDFLRGPADAKIAPDGVSARNPAFDVTPAALITAIFTERGEIAPPSETTLAALAR